MLEGGRTKQEENPVTVDGGRKLVWIHDPDVGWTMHLQETTLHKYKQSHGLPTSKLNAVMGGALAQQTQLAGGTTGRTSQGTLMPPIGIIHNIFATTFLGSINFCVHTAGDSPLSSGEAIIKIVDAYATKIKGKSREWYSSGATNIFGLGNFARNEYYYEQTKAGKTCNRAAYRYPYCAMTADWDGQGGGSKDGQSCWCGSYRGDQDTIFNPETTPFNPNKYELSAVYGLGGGYIMYNYPNNYYPSGDIITLSPAPVFPNWLAPWQKDMQMGILEFADNRIGNAVGMQSFLFETPVNNGDGDPLPAVGRNTLDSILPTGAWNSQFPVYPSIDNSWAKSGGVPIGYNRLHEAAQWAMAYLIDKLQRTMKVLGNNDQCCPKPPVSPYGYGDVRPELIIHLTKEQEQNHHPLTDQTIEEWWGSFEHSWQPVTITSGVGRPEVSALRNEIAGTQIGAFIDSWISLGLPTRVVKTETGITSCDYLTKDDIFTT